MTYRALQSFRERRQHYLRQLCHDSGMILGEPIDESHTATVWPGVWHEAGCLAIGDMLDQTLNIDHEPTKRLNEAFQSIRTAVKNGASVSVIFSYICEAEDIAFGKDPRS